MRLSTTTGRRHPPSQLHINLDHHHYLYRLLQARTWAVAIPLRISDSTIGLLEDPLPSHPVTRVVGLGPRRLTEHQPLVISKFATFSPNTRWVLLGDFRTNLAMLHPQRTLNPHHLCSALITVGPLVAPDFLVRSPLYPRRDVLAWRATFILC